MYSLFPLLFANTNILTEKRVNVETIDGLPLLYKKKFFTIDSKWWIWYFYNELFWKKKNREKLMANLLTTQPP